MHIYSLYLFSGGFESTLEKTEGAVNNRQSRDTGNIEYTRHRTKINKAQHNRKLKQ